MKLLPTEFRIFKRGVNTSVKGTFLFDAQAAKDVMADFAKHGADIMIDLEHLSLDEESKAYDPDARGWCRLAVRNGELWATQVRWTPDGAARLSDRKQRYISPTFLYDKATRRVFSIHNAAICGAPALDNMPALVEASKKFSRGKSLGLVSLSITTKGDPMDPELLTALGLPEDATLEDVLAAIKVLQEAANPTADDEGTDDEAASDKGDDGEAGPEQKLKAKMTARREAAAALSAAGNNVVIAMLKKLDKRLDGIDARVEGNERLDLIKANSKKFTPALEKAARKWDLETLKSFIKAAPDAVEDDEEPEEDVTAVRGAAALSKGKKVELSKTELEMCKATGRKPAVLLAFKQKQAEKESA